MKVYSSYHRKIGSVTPEEWENRKNPNNNGYIKVNFEEFSQEVPIIYLKEA